MKAAHDVMCWKIWQKINLHFPQFVSRSLKVLMMWEDRVKKFYILFCSLWTSRGGNFVQLDAQLPHLSYKDVEITAARAEMLLKHLRMKWNFVNLFFLLRARTFSRHSDQRMIFLRIHNACVLILISFYIPHTPLLFLPCRYHNIKFNL